MPGRNGMGPMGLGKMTGKGNGVCVVALSSNDDETKNITETTFGNVRGFGRGNGFGKGLRDGFNGSKRGKFKGAGRRFGCMRNAGLRFSESSSVAESVLTELKAEIGKINNRIDALLSDTNSKEPHNG